MPSRRAGILLLLLFLAGSFDYCPPTIRSSPATHLDRWKCDFHVSKGVWHRKQLIRCEDERIGAPGSAGYIIGIARCESGEDLQDKYADDPRTPNVDEGDEHGGPFQQAVQYWLQRFRNLHRRSDVGLERDVTDFRAVTIISLRQAKSKGTWAADWACA